MQKLEEILTKTRTQLWYEISLRILRDRLPRLLIIKLIRSLLTTKLIFWSRIFFTGPTYNRVSKRESITKARDLSLCPSCPNTWFGLVSIYDRQRTKLKYSSPYHRTADNFYLYKNRTKVQPRTSLPWTKQVTCNSNTQTGTNSNKSAHHRKTQSYITIVPH